MKNFLISGCFRSGTTLTRLCLNSHSKITCHDEGLSRYQLNNGIEVGENLTGYKVPFLSLRANKLTDTFGDDVKIIWLLRFSLASICSMVDMPEIESNGEWFFERWLKYELYEQRELLFKITPKIEIANKLKGRERKLAFASIVWSACYQSLEYNNSSNFKVINYEDFVRNPELNLNSICDFLGVKYEENLMQHHFKNHSEVLGSVATGGTSAKREIDCESIDKWREKINESEKSLCLSFVY